MFFKDLASETRCMEPTLAMFDEFPDLVENYSDAQRHVKRVQLEALVFSSLQIRYGSALRNAFSSWIAPLQPSKRIVIVERRIHPNLEFILHNAAYFGQEGEWAISIVCSDVNHAFVKGIVGTKSIQIHPMFQGNPAPAIGKQIYNELLQTTEFYELFSEENLILMEMDCYFRKQIPDLMLSCDYVASPYAWNQTMAGSGISFRKRSVMLEICRCFPEKEEAQDVYASKGIQALGYSMPPLLYSKDLFAESILDADPIGVHQWWTFYSPKMADAEAIFQRFMTLEIKCCE